MLYRKLKADKIFDGFGWVDDDVVLIVEHNGTVRDIVYKNEAGDGIEQFEGILTPGFINSHCHLELSHLKNKMPTHKGLVSFLIAVIKTRAAKKEDIIEHISAAEKEMFENGIVAVADICNTDYAVAIKSKSKLYWHNLIEVINLHDENLQKQFIHFNHVLEQHDILNAEKATTTLTPHAPYSVSAETFKALNKATANSIISIHNQESSSENELFKNGKGDFLKLFAAFGEAGSPVEASGKTSLQTWLHYFTNGQTILLVHNTFIHEEDIVFAKAYSEKYGIKIVYCLCPNANLYIENTLPPVDVLLKHDCQIVIGTDSYAGNWQLNIADEMKTLTDNFPHITLLNILQWATSNGAEVLGLSSMLGSFKIGKKPGVVLLNTDSTNKTLLTGKSTRIF
jgi:cytosine/adenosine deaminase-related metal-dependent hydrolase